MKGLIFVEFLEFVEDRHSLDMVDRIIEASDLPSGGAYTSVGVYDHHEMLTLVGRLSEETGIAPGDLVRAFGRHTFARFAAAYPHLYAGVDGAVEFLAGIQEHIHVEVKKLYPEAELPSFTYEEVPGVVLAMVYRSPRCLADLAEGLIVGCVEHFAADLVLTREDLAEDGSHVRFLLAPREP